MVTDTSEPRDAADTADERAEPRPRRGRIVAYDSDSWIVFCDRANSDAWIAIDADAVRSLEDRR